MLHVEGLRPGNAADGAIVVATIDRQARRNAVDTETLVSLSRALDDFEANRASRVFVLRGAGGHFSSGADLSSVSSSEFRGLLVETVSRLANVSLVTLAQVDGSCLGAGLQLAAACDLRVASDHAVFGIPAAKLGVAVDLATVDRLVDLVGGAFARSILLAAELVDVSSARSYGLIHRIGTYDDALTWAETISHLSPLSHAAHKLALANRATDVGVSDRVVTAVDRAWGSADFVEGRTAFDERRPAIFTGE